MVVVLVSVSFSLLLLVLGLWVEAWTMEWQNPRKKRRSKQLLRVSWSFGVLGFMVVLVGLICPWLKDWFVVSGMTLTATSIPMATKAEVLGSTRKDTKALRCKIKRYAAGWAFVAIVSFVVSVVV